MGTYLIAFCSRNNFRICNFLLSSTFSGHFDSSLASIGLEAAEEDPENGQDGTVSSSRPRKNHSAIADALAKGFSVNVNGSPWPRTFVRIDDELDEAVIIIYALMPGRQYDIELGLVPAGHPTSIVHRQVTTDDVSDNEDAEVHTDPESPTLDNSTSSSDPHSTPSTSPSRTVPGTPPNASPQITLEDRLTQLQHTLSAVNSEREALLSSLKSARRDTQKAESALRSEIDTLKRTSEKNTAAELKGKQKVLALQEAVKRAQNATKETEELTAEVEATVPELNKRKEEKEVEHSKIKLEAEKARKEREGIEEKERKRLDAMKAELAGLTDKLEKLGSKREKLESTVIPDIEEKLRDIEKEIEVEEMGLAQFKMEETSAFSRTQIAEDLSPTFPRRRHHSTGEKLSPIGRPAPAPIQRPDPSGSSLNGSINVSSGSLWSPTHFHRQQSQGQSHQTHNPRSHSYHNHKTPILLMHPQQQRRKSLKSNSTPPTSTSTSTMKFPLPSLTTTTTSSSTANSSPTSTSPTRTTAASTLSSRAPAFEPSRPIKNIVAASHNNNGQSQFHGGPSNSTITSPVILHRPAGANAVSAVVGSGRSVTGQGQGQNGVIGARNGAVNATQWPAMHGHGHGHRDSHAYGGFDAR